MQRIGQWCLALLIGCLLGVQNARAQSAVEFTAQSAEYYFGESLDFSASFTSRPVILEGYVFYQVGDDPRTWVYEGEITPGQLDVHVALDNQNQPQAFRPIRYWFRIASDHGDFFESPVYHFTYEDNRFTWQQAQLAPFTLLWHSGQPADATRLLAAARASVLRLQALLPLPEPQPLTLRVYNQPADLERAAVLAHYPWAAGHMPPGQGVLLFALGPDVEAQVQQEVAHQMLYDGLGASGYANLPAWLRAGIAYGLASDGQAATAELQTAAAAGSLLPLYTLCQALPGEGAQAQLALQQSAALVRYLLQRFNTAGFGVLVEAYARSGDCINATQAAFGVDLLQLEQDWYQASFASHSVWPQVQWRALAAAAGVAALLWGLMRLAARGGAHHG